MHVRRLTETDVPAAMRLSTQAGWNQVAADWHRLLTLSPDGCFAGWVDDELVATTTVVTHEDGTSWVGMVLVDAEHRRQGYGEQILRHALDATQGNERRTIGLDATDQGLPLYRRYGFEELCQITRLSGTPRRAGSTDDVQTIAAADGTGLSAFDAAACGTERRELVERLLSEPRSVGFACPGVGDPDGYAILRPGRNHWQLGPVVAEGTDVLGRLLDAAAERLDGESVIVDSLADGAADELLVERGLSPQRHLSRMTYPDATPLLTGDAVVAAAGLELG